MKSVLLDLDGNANQRLEEMPTKIGVENIRSKLAFFDTLSIIKVANVPRMIGTEYRVEDFRRLTNFDYAEDQNFLAGKGLILAKTFQEGSFLETSINAMVSSFSNEPLKTELIIPDRIARQLSQTNPCIVMKAIDGFTIPPDDAALEDVLKFKELRRAEYEAFWYCVDEISNEIEWLGDSNSLTALKGNLLAALGDFERVNSEKWGRRVVDSMSLKFAIGARQAVALGAAALTDFANMPPMVTLLVGAAGFMEFSLETCPSMPPLSNRARAMSYASHVRKLT